ncbi:MAG: Na+/H+ antiporter subunit E [Actinomycetaceae bacterium]|nr:Na+/H+ antiporter subunit E [Actinomycetaceae bacterium]
MAVNPLSNRFAATGLRGGPKPKRLSRGLTVWLTALWMLMFASFTWLSFLSGVLVAVAVQLIFPLPRARNRVKPQLFATVWLAVRFVADMVRAAVHIAIVVATGRKFRCSIVRVDLNSREEIVLAIVAAMTNLVPGTIVVSIDRAHSRMYLHVFDLAWHGGVDAVRQAGIEQEQRVLKALGWEGQP